MKKALVLFVVVFCAVLSSQASYLYWQVSASDIGSGYVSGNSYLGVVYAVQSGNAATVVDKGSAPSSGPYSVDVSAYSDGSYSFYVEVFNYNSGTVTSDDKVATLDSQTYSQLLDKGAIVTGADLSVGMTQIWHGGANYSAAPEPTSGLLMMVGLALLGLKRRKA